MGVLKVVSIRTLPTEVSWTLYSSPPATVGSFLISIGHLHSTSPVCVCRLVMSLLPQIFITSQGEFFFGRTFDLVSQNSSNYACVVKVRHTPNERTYVAVLYMRYA